MEEGGRVSPPFADLEMIRVDVSMPVSRFSELIGIPRRTYHHRLAVHRAGRVVEKGPWPTPAQDVCEQDVVATALEFPAWGHRKIAAISAHDHPNTVTSPSTVCRVMGRNGLLQPVEYQAERRQLARARRECFVDPPVRRNRVWQADFSDYETDGAGKWVLGGLVDYWAKPVLACTVGTTQNANDLIAVFETAIRAAEHQLGYPLILDCVNNNGVIEPIVIVTDNGGPMRSAAVARWFAARPHFVHVRTKVKSPGTNGVIERFFQSIKYEHLYRQPIEDGADLGDEVDLYCDLYNHIRPHEAIAMTRPADRYLQKPTTKQTTATI